jgi:hypothetical protein
MTKKRQKNAQKVEKMTRKSKKSQKKTQKMHCIFKIGDFLIAWGLSLTARVVADGGGLLKC